MSMRPFQKHSQLGLTLVELMVALVIGLITILVVTQFAISFQSQKRSTVGEAGSMDEGAVAMNTLKREIMGAGYGIIDPDLTGCRVQAHDARPDNPATARDFSFSIYPAWIDQGPGGTSDSLAVNYSNSPMLAGASTLIQDFPGDETTNLKLKTRYGFYPGDRVILADSPKKPTARDCSMYQVTFLPTSSGDEDTLEHKNTTYLDITGQTRTSQWNKSGGLGITINGVVQAGAKFEANKTKIFNLGPTPISNNFYVQDGRLMYLDAYSGNTYILLSNVVSFQAQYGFDGRAGTHTDLVVPQTIFTIGSGGYSDSMLDVNGDAVTGDGRDWLRLGAIRIAIVVRNNHPEITNGTCSATSTPPSWSWGSVPAGTMSADWQCYKYKVFETVVPLRNMMWRPKTNDE